MKKRSMAVMAAFALAAAGCSGGSGGANPSSGGAKPADSAPAKTEAPAKQVTLSYALWDKNQVPAMEEIIKKFKEKQPNIDVKIELTPSGKEYWQKMETAAIGGTLPDVLWMNGPNIVKYASNGMLMAIGDQVKASGLDLKNYPESLVNLYTVGGKLYGIPKDFDTVGMWYNKKMFDEAGVKYPDGNWDWNAVVEAAKKLTNPGKGVWGIAADMNSQEAYYNTIIQAGGGVISDDKKKSGYDSPEAIAGLKFWTDLIHVHKVSPTLAQMTDTTPIKLFESGKVAMLWAGSWNAIEFAKNEFTKDKVDVAALPKQKQQGVVIHGLANVISAKTKNPKEAWTFVSFLGSKEAAEILAKTGTVIPAFNGTQTTWVKSTPQFNLQVYIDMLSYSKPYPVSKDTSKWNNLETEYFKKAWTGELKIEDAAKQVATKMNEFLAQEK
ncbi:ABC transporter substrate-binding protein [Paenibacillus flagellatus]|uniref:Sugar ABC transporter substrate-binding protein n=1 Tax=Paenibacillus flagellatus TaxID=2211139 RepID=A0A2V5KGB5_9BACL|nr:sugar ABC transporter substrate-binding protein [Paenibacillus flagellatus]PYI57343.1 sugar ABC transporter substrate-binding protein [Paenibacillus flagellatus]